MPHQIHDLDCSRSALDMGTTMVVAVEMSKSSLFLRGVLPGVELRPTKKLSVDDDKLLAQIDRWCDEAKKKISCAISRICVAYEAGRNGFWG